MTNRNVVMKHLLLVKGRLRFGSYSNTARTIILSMIVTKILIIAVFDVYEGISFQNMISKHPRKNRNLDKNNKPNRELAMQYYTAIFYIYFLLLSIITTRLVTTKLLSLKEVITFIIFFPLT